MTLTEILWQQKGQLANFLTNHPDFAQMQFEFEVWLFSAPSVAH